MLMAFLLVLPVVTFAGDDDAQRRLRVEQLLDLIDADLMIDNVYDQMNQVMAQTADQMKIQPGERAVLDRYHSRVTELLKSDFSWEKLKPPMIDLYLKHYSDQEISDMITFYQTPSGKSLLKKMPLVMRDSVQLSQQKMQVVFPKIQQLIEEMATEIETTRKAQD